MGILASDSDLLRLSCFVGSLLVMSRALDDSSLWTDVSVDVYCCSALWKADLTGILDFGFAWSSFPSHCRLSRKPENSGDGFLLPLSPSYCYFWLSDGELMFMFTAPEIKGTL